MVAERRQPARAAASRRDRLPSRARRHRDHGAARRPGRRPLRAGRDRRRRDRVRRIVGRPPPRATSRLRGLMFPGLHVLEPAIFALDGAGGRVQHHPRHVPRRCSPQGLPVYRLRHRRPVDHHRHAGRAGRRGSRLTPSVPMRTTAPVHDQLSNVRGVRRTRFLNLPRRQFSDLLVCARPAVNSAMQ